MNANRRATCALPFLQNIQLARAVLVLAVWGMGGYLLAQEPQLRIGYSPASDKAQALSENFVLSVRPNIEQPIYLFVANPSKKAGKFAVVVGSSRAEVSFDKDESIKMVRFAKPTPPVPAAGAPPAAPKPAWVDLEGPKTRLALQLLQEGNPAPIETREIPVELQRASDYVKVSAGPTYDPKEKELSVTVTATDEFKGPPCTVQLVLLPGPGRIPGLRMPIARDADLQGVLAKTGDTATLYARGLNLGAETKGQFYLTVDGYQHASVYNIDFANVDQGIKAISGTESYRILAPRSAPAGAKIPVRIEVDDSAEPDATLELALGQLKGMKFEKKSVTLLQGSREKKARFSPSLTDASLVFQIEVKDWVVDFDTTGAVGERLLRVARLNKDGSVAKEGDRATIILDGTPPEVTFVAVPATALLGAAVPFKASGKDEESGIQEVVFFLGKPPADGKLPPTLEVYKATKGDKDVWTAMIPMPTDKKGPTVVSVLFVNNAGLPAFASATVTLIDPRDPPPPVPPGRIEGKVVQGPLPQPGLEVVLFDDKGKEKAKAKTDDKGKFAFEGVPAGSYSVASAKADSSSGTKGITMPVVVVPDKTVDIEVKLFRSGR